MEVDSGKMSPPGTRERLRPRALKAAALALPLAADRQEAGIPV